MKANAHPRALYSSVFLTNTFLLIASLALTAHYRVFFGSHFVEYIQASLQFVHHDAFSSGELWGMGLGLLLSFVICRVVSHRFVALSALLFFAGSLCMAFFVVDSLISTILGFFVGISTAFLLSGGAGAATFTMRREFITNRTLPAPRPVGFFIVMPLFLGGVFLLPRNYGLIVPLGVVLVILLTIVYTNAHIYKKWARFTSAPSFVMVMRQTVMQIRFWIIIVGLILVVFVESSILSSFPKAVTQFFMYHGVTSPYEFISAILFLLFLLRTSLILFTAASLRYVPPRRLILYSGLALSFCLFVLMFVENTRDIVIRIIALLVGVPLFPAFIQGVMRITTREVFTYAMALLGLISFCIPLLVFTVLPRVSAIYANSEKVVLIIPSIMLALLSVGYFVYQYRYLVTHHESRTIHKHGT